MPALSITDIIHAMKLAYDERTAALRACEAGDYVLAGSLMALAHDAEARARCISQAFQVEA